ncbi:hypothetical protein [Sphingomonas sp. 3-13AW]|uniref:hypothetical protein n=1 Tax=Sphingomonas sp. 3-13AW TaxID=3050450 RepID=UPI003BB4A304
MKSTPVSVDALAAADRIVTGAISTAYPDASALADTVYGERATHLKIAVALSYYSRYAAAADRGFGPDNEMTLAFLDIATTLAAPIGDETSRLVDAALAG